MASFGSNNSQVSPRRPIGLYGVVSALIFTAGLGYFSYALIGLTKEIAAVRQELPAVLHRVDNIVEQIKQSSIPLILAETAEVRKAIPPILVEIAAVREELPAILRRIDDVNTALPGILTQIDGVNQRVDKVSAQIPAILQRIDKVTLQTRTLVPAILNESKELRADIPVSLDRVERLVAESDKIGENASKGATKGAIKGIIETPIDATKRLLNVPVNFFEAEGLGMDSSASDAEQTQQQADKK